MVKNESTGTNWGYVIKRLREGRRISQPELSKKSGVTIGYLTKIEIGRIKDPSSKTIQKLAWGLDLTEVELRTIIYGQPPLHHRSLRDALDAIADLVQVPIYDDLNAHASKMAGVVGYVYLQKSQAVGKDVFGVYCRGRCLAPKIEEGDFLICSSDANLDPGHIAICLIHDEVHLGYLKKIDNEQYISNGDGMVRIEDCQDVARVLYIQKAA